ncbi:MAG: adenine methyltransferase [Patescibacteria group bacterium]|nr:adenine methyltransferase [Patescibacteria group bacterium]
MKQEISVRTLGRKGYKPADRNEWETPEMLFEALNKEFDFDLDPCCTTENRKTLVHFTKEADGLTHSWQGRRVFMNPPYDRKEIKRWVKKAHEEANEKTLVVGLLPASTCSSWFHQHIYGKAEIRFIKGRVRFVGSQHNAPFPSMIVIWGAY